MTDFKLEAEKIVEDTIKLHSHKSMTERIQKALQAAYERGAQDLREKADLCFDDKQHSYCENDSDCCVCGR